MAVSASLKKPNFALNVAELILAAVSIGVVIDGYPVADTLPKTALIYGTQVGFIMVGLILVLSSVFDSPLHRTILLLISLVGLGMWTATGALIVHSYQQSSYEFLGISVKPADRYLASGVAALTNALAHLGDLVFTFKK